MIYCSFRLLGVVSFNHFFLSSKNCTFIHLRSFKTLLTKKAMVLKRCFAGALFYSISSYLRASCFHQIINVWNKINSAARNNQLSPFKVQFHSKKQLSKMALWDSTLGISQWPPDQICTVYSIMCFLPTARPANRSQVLKLKLCSFWLMHYQQQLKKNKLEVKFCPKLHLCNLRDLECSF